mgnify:CR=1 FL=1
MIFVFWIVLGLAVGAFHAFRGREGRSHGETAAIFLRWWLGITVGIGSLIGAGFHIFDAKETAEQICFTRGDGGFQFENAMMSPNSSGKTVSDTTNSAAGSTKSVRLPCSPRISTWLQQRQTAHNM